jgi:hypothetical protein
MSVDDRADRRGRSNGRLLCAIKWSPCGTKLTCCGLYALAESPVGPAAWLFDHGDGYAQPAAAITSAVLDRTINGHSAGDLTRDDVLDNFTLYWLTNAAVSAAVLRRMANAGR